jgi:predicted lipoprotein with Yx(FWY)xxD motif
VKKVLIGVAPVATVLAVAACGGGYSSHSTAPTNRTGDTAAVTLGHANLGSYLTDARGRALYLFEADKGTTSSCYSACASLWPPLTSAGGLTPGAGVTQALLGKTRRTDGAAEVTYRGHPLYYYAGDTGPGSITGQGLNQFGAKWYLVAPNGNKIGTNGH